MFVRQTFPPIIIWFSEKWVPFDSSYLSNMASTCDLPQVVSAVLCDMFPLLAFWDCRWRPTLKLNDGSCVRDSRCCPTSNFWYKRHAVQLFGRTRRLTFCNWCVLISRQRLRFDIPDVVFARVSCMKTLVQDQVVEYLLNFACRGPKHPCFPFVELLGISFSFAKCKVKDEERKSH